MSKTYTTTFEDFNDESEHEVSFECPDLNGSEKQIEFANAIRDQYANKFLELLGGAKTQNSEFANKKIAVTEYFLNSTDSKIWIYFKSTCGCGINELFDKITISKGANWLEKFENFKQYIIN